MSQANLKDDMLGTYLCVLVPKKSAQWKDFDTILFIKEHYINRFVRFIRVGQAELCIILPRIMNTVHNYALATRTTISLTNQNPGLFNYATQIMMHV
jgi:hypothetical protein